MVRPLNIVHILDKNGFDTGSVHQMFQAAAGLRERGHEVAVVSRPSSEMAQRCGAADVRFVPMGLRNELDLRSIRALARLFREQRTDVIHVHKGRPHTLALAASWFRPVGAFVVNRGVSFDLTVWNRPKYVTRRVDRIVTVCEEIRQVIIRSGRVRPAKVEVIYAGTDVDEFHPDRWNREDFRHERGIPEEMTLFATIGIRDWKGWREVVDAVADLRRSGVNAGAMLIGCKSAAHQTMVNEHGAARGIAEWIWAVEPRADMPRVLSAADGVVDASWAGTGITGTIREGMALARPVIATDCGGNAELVDGSTGWLVAPRNSEALVTAMRDVVNGGSAVTDKARAARQRVVERFSREARLDRLEALYSEILLAKTERSKR